ncbi:PHP domain-containing protein [Elusimicrobiota bacterium]
MIYDVDNKRIDLHIHTTYSDGTLTPKEVVKISRSKGLAAIAITDHDITDGIEPALKYGAKVGLEVIPGIELSCEYKSTEIHILGYYINWENSWFQGKLEVFQKARERRAYYMLNKFKEIGIKIDEQMLFTKSHAGSISRIHFARCLEEMGIVETTREAFEKYLANGRPAYVPKLRITPEEAMSMIHRVGGISIIAHPIFGGGHKNFLKKLKRLGLSGIEVYHPSQNINQCERLSEIARDLDLGITGGTDSHGERKDENPIGSLDIGYCSVDMLKEIKHHSERKNKIILTSHN